MQLPYCSVQNFPRFGCEGFDRKGFFEKTDAFVKYAMMGNNIGSITGHEEGFNPWPLFPDFFTESFAIHIGHDHIGDQEVNDPIVVLNKREGLQRGLSRDNGVPVPLQNFFTQQKDGGFIFNQEDGFVTARRFVTPWFGNIIGQGLAAWQINPEGRALARLAVNINEPVVLFDDAVHCRQSHARSFSQLFGGEERFEKMGQVFFVYSAP